MRMGSFKIPMNKGIFVAIMVALVAISCAKKKDDNNAVTQDGVVKKNSITLTEVTSIETMLGNPEEYKGKTVLIEGHVVGRCMGSGCWIALSRGEGKDGLIVRTPDESFIFPAECIDKDVLVQGRLTVKEHEHAEHHHHDHGDSEHDHHHHDHMGHDHDHDCPAPEFYFYPTGLKIKA